MKKKNITKEKSYNIEFQLTEQMIRQFIDLSGDCSSLHTDRAFARRSIYRRNVIHGMLPIMFISALKLWRSTEHICYFRRISARFIRPIFFNARFLLSAEVSEVDEEKNEIKLEYVLKNLETGMIFTTGNFTFGYSNFVTSKNQKHKSGSPPNVNRCMVIDPLTEQDLEFDQISKGDEKSFQFLISDNHVHALYEILNKGLLPDCRLDFLAWINNLNSTNLLSTSLLSTFVGMCTPGRYATFMDFDVAFKTPIQQYKKYLLTGNVGFKSQSTFTVVENIVINDSIDKVEPHAMGKIKVRVNEPPIKMPSIESLNKNELDLHLKDKVVLVTGASRGIGEVTAKLFSLYGSKVVVNYFHGKEDANRIVDEIVKGGGNALAVQADVSNRQQVKQMMSTICKHYGTVHVLVNNAVRDFYPAPFMELVWDDFQKDIDVSVKGAINCCQEALSLMLKNKNGKIINMSTVAVEDPPPNQSKYVVAKSALAGLTRSLAVEFAPYNIQINMVEPSMVETDLTKHIPKMFIKGMKNDTPMKRNATPIDVAKAIIFLASNLASFTTGQKIMVTGGNSPFL